MHDHSPLLKRACLGAAGGFLGTLAIQGLMAATKRWLPQAMPPMRQAPGEFMVDHAEEALPNRIREHVPKAAESAAAQGLGMGYGVAFGALYGLVQPRDGSTLLGGSALGLGCWMAGYHGWLPALGLTPPLHEQTAAQISGPIVDHLAYGIVTAAAYDWLCDQFDPAAPVEQELGTEAGPELAVYHG
jgi:hypothetical protein